jgi:hypothetical protein
MYVVKVLEGHPKGKHRKLKHHTIFKVKQQPPENTCGFFVCINIFVFGSQPNCVVCVSASILIYLQKIHVASLFASTYLYLDRGRIVL